MKRLFQVNGQHFGNKVDAKKARGERNANGNYTHTISKGPDHIGNHGHSVPSTRHRGPQQGFTPKAA